MNDIFRITHKEGEGYSVEIKKKNWFGKAYWTHFISFYGNPTDPYYFSSYDSALNQLLFEIAHQCKNNSDYYDN